MKKNGFTLVEVLGVIVVLGIILSIAVPMISKRIEDTEDNLLIVQLKEIKNGAVNWSEENYKSLPETEGASIVITLGDLKTGGFVNSKIENPKTQEKFPDTLQIEIKRNGNLYDYILESQYEILLNN